jgi:ppGpp synthetase/RelA/SpoT-type nucleotidyltranferase
MSTPDPDKRRIITAGKTLADANAGLAAREAAVQIVSDWRGRHIVPMGILAIDLINKCLQVDSRAFTAQRLKRLESITAKLSRKEVDLPNINLWTMQDIGGCRAILPTVAGVRAVDSHYARDPSISPKRKDYIATPKESGYRGIHLIFRYRGTGTTEYDGMQIEIQLRSRLQHIWATAVETVGYFTNQSLKSSVGPERWLRFFTLMSAFIALKEQCPHVPNTPETMSELIAQLRPYALEARDHFSAYESTIHHAETFRGHEESDYYLLTLSAVNRMWRMQGFSRERLEEANRKYAAAEADGYNAVLVSTESLSTLWKAYPNYFLDLRAFTRIVHEVISDHWADSDSSDFITRFMR